MDLEIASLHNNDNLDEIISILYEKFPLFNKTEKIKNEMLYISLSWVYDARNKLENCLAVLADIYEIFEYPKELEQFVYYLPSDRIYHSKREFENATLINLKKYLTNFKSKLL